MWKILTKKAPYERFFIYHGNRFNDGYLFLQDIYYELGLDKICRAALMIPEDLLSSPPLTANYVTPECIP